MKNIKNFNKFDLIKEEASPRLPNSEEYWTKRGKKGKVVALYTHDDMDGIFCAIEMKKYLLNHGFTIEKYGILNYTDGWKYTDLDKELINIVLDFANMPNDERDNDVDYYLDHHGLFSEEDKEKYKSSPVQKKSTASAYEAICQALGIAQDSLTLDVIDMIDAAKYDDHGVSWQRLLDFNLSEIKKSNKRRLEFAAAFNQFLKRSDTKTIISVIENCKDASIFSIYNVMKLIHPHHNQVMSGPRKGQKKDFIEDSNWRMGEMQKKTRGSERQKIRYNSQAEFLQKFKNGNFIQINGYQVIGDLAYVPTGTWANALRARTIIEKDVLDGYLEFAPKFILLQYGGTLQVCSFKKMKDIDSLPILKGGKSVDDLGHYMTSLLKNFQEHLGYHEPDTSIGQDEITVSGGHGGIGSISNIYGTCKVGQYDGVRYVDMFKNKIISDLSGVAFNLSQKWSEPADQFKPKEPEMNYKVIKQKDVTKVDNVGNVTTSEPVEENFEYSIIDKNTGVENNVSIEDFLKAGAEKGMKNITLDSENRRVIARFESFKNKY